MTHVDEIGLSWQELGRMADVGWIRVQSHPALSLFIWNYTEAAQFKKHWNEYTLAARGLITDSVGNIVARPWKKFFNLGDGFAEFDWDSPAEVTDKMDGSLGILYNDGSGWAIATRGSFDSDQARHATKTWAEKYSQIHPPVEYTFLFEIVYPANRIVLNYGDLDDLVLLGAVNIEYGYYLGPYEAGALLEWTGPVTQVFSYKNLQEAFSADPRTNAEGYVVRSGNKMVKIKQTDYLDLHRIVTNLNERTIWERISSGETTESICDQIPDEFHKFVQDVASDLEEKFEARMDDILVEFIEIREGVKSPDGMFTRKEFAQAVANKKDKKYFFKLLDGSPIDTLVWDELKPSVSKE